VSGARTATVSPPAPHGGEPVERLVPVLRLPGSPASLGPRLTPAQVRTEAAGRGWRTMAGFQTRNPVHRAHEYLHKVALEHVDGLLLHPLVGETKDDAYDAGELGIEPLRFEHAFFSRRCDGMATSRTCPHQPASRLHLSGTAVRAMLERGELPPPEFSRPEVARVLVDGYRATSKG